MDDTTPPSAPAYQRPDLQTVRHGGTLYRVPTDCSILAVLSIDRGVALVALRRQLRPRPGGWPDALVIREYIWLEGEERWTPRRVGITLPMSLAAGLSGLLDEARRAAAATEGSDR